MLITLSEDHKLHFPKGELHGGELVRPFECPERWDYIVAQLRAVGLTDFRAPAPLDFATVARVHDQDYLEFLRHAWQQWSAQGFNGDAIATTFPARRLAQRVPEHIEGKLGYYCMAVETEITRGTWQAACSAAACAQTAARSLDTAHRAAFALCRPPGHHAGKDLFGGYCFLNNAAIAAQALLDSGAQRVALLDVDFHHGNGTQDIFFSRPEVLFISLHGSPQQAFPHFSGYADEQGVGAGEGFNINYPMDPGTSYAHWCEALDAARARIAEYSPDALVVSLGVDTFKHDPISFFSLESDDFRDYGQRLAGLRVPSVFVMEGGYAVAEIGINTVNVLSGFLDA